LKKYKVESEFKVTIEFSIRHSAEIQLRIGKIHHKVK